MSNSTKFIDYITVLKRTGQRGPLSQIKKAASKGTRDRAWEHLAAFEGLSSPETVAAYSTVGSAYALSSGITVEGMGNLGVSLRYLASANGSVTGKGGPVDSRFQRLIRCRTSLELCAHLQPVLRLIASKGVRVDYGKALEDVLSWNEEVKRKWAVSYYIYPTKE